MTGRTHWAVGTAAALCVTQPARLRDWVLCIGAAAVGSVISDIDVTTSDSRETLNRITAVSVLAVAAVGIAEVWWDLGIIRNFDRESSLSCSLHLWKESASPLVYAFVPGLDPAGTDHRVYLSRYDAVFFHCDAFSYGDRSAEPAECPSAVPAEERIQLRNLQRRRVGEPESVPCGNCGQRARFAASVLFPVSERIDRNLVTKIIGIWRQDT